MLVHGLQQQVVGLPAGLVLNHADLLSDDPLLLLHALLGEIGNGDKGQQGFQVFPELVGTLKVVPGDGSTGEGIGGSAGGGEGLQGIAPVRGVKHLVLQIVGDAHGGV